MLLHLVTRRKILIIKHHLCSKDNCFHYIQIMYFGLKLNLFSRKKKGKARVPFLPSYLPQNLAWKIHFLLIGQDNLLRGVSVGDGRSGGLES